MDAEGRDFHRELTREIGVEPGSCASFRVIWRDALAEVYLDDYQLHIINHRKPPTGRIGLITSGGRNVIGDLEAWYAEPGKGMFENATMRRDHGLNR